MFTPQELLKTDDQESWAISYIDLLLLMVTVFVLLLTYQQQAKEEKLENTQKTVVVGQQQAFIDEIYRGQLKDRVTVSKERDQVKLVMSDSILFYPADATLNRSGEAVLDEIAAMLKNRPWHVLVEGHTDNQPISTPRYASNWELSSDRAIKVTRYLISKGVIPQRLSAVGYAATRPVSTNQTIEGRAKNRRVMIILSAPNELNQAETKAN